MGLRTETRLDFFWSAFERQVPGERMARRAWGIAAVVLASYGLAGCGAKTGLGTPDIVVDVSLSDVVSDQGDAASDIVAPIAQCSTTRVHTRIGYSTTVHPDTNASASTGYMWSIASAPDGSTARLFGGDAYFETITPDVVGTYDLDVVVPAPGNPGGTLNCQVVIIADLPDPTCPGYTLVEPQVVDIPLGDMSVGYDPEYLGARASANGNAGALYSDDPNSRVATVAIERPTMSGVAPGNALQVEGQAAEGAIMSALGAVGVLVGRTGVTHAMFPIRRTTLRVLVNNPITPADVRDQSAVAIAQMPAPAGTPVYAPAEEFYIEVATILRADTNKVVITVTVSPVATYDDPTTDTSIVVEDFANATEIAPAGSTLGVRCDQNTELAAPKVDFLWFVDTTTAMIPYRMRIGAAAQSFFT